MNNPTKVGEPAPKDSASLLAHSRQELRWMLGFWALLLFWVIGYCSLFGYGEVGTIPPMSFGLPSWVVWGVFVPWLLATTVTSWFAIRWIADDDLSTVASISNPQDEVANHG